MDQNTAVIFDMDGVIFDSERLVLECWEKIGEKYHLKGMREAFTPCIGANDVRTRELVLEYYGQSFPYDEFRKESSALCHEIIDTQGLPLKAGVKEILAYLKEMGIPTGLASSTRLSVVTEELGQAGLYDYFQVVMGGDQLKIELGQAGLYDYFQVVMGGDQLKRSKPEPDIYLMTCEKMGIAPQNAYAVEDSYNGIRSAYSAGMKPIMVPDLLPATEEMRKKSVVILENLLQVREYFAR